MFIYQSYRITFDSVKQLRDHESNVLDPLLRSGDPVIQPHTVVKLPATLVYHCIEEGEGRVTGVRLHFQSQETYYLTSDDMEVRMVLFVY